MLGNISLIANTSSSLVSRYRNSITNVSLIGMFLLGSSLLLRLGLHYFVNFLLNDDNDEVIDKNSLEDSLMYKEQ